MTDVASFVDRAKRLATYLGEPFARKDIPPVDVLIEEFYLLPGNGAGGLLHVVLDDSNWADEHIEWCRERAREANDEATYWLAQILLSFLHEERAALACVCPCCKEDEFGHSATGATP